MIALLLACGDPGAARIPRDRDEDLDSTARDTGLEPTGHTGARSCPDDGPANTTGARDDFDVCGVGRGAGDLVVPFRAPADGTWALDVAADWPAVVAVSPECPPPADAPCGPAAVALRAGEVVFLAVDGRRGAEGAFVVSAAPVPEADCADGADDDADGPADCADPDCAGAPACAVCPDGVLVEGVPLGGATAGRPDDLAPSCLDAGGADAGFTFVAPRDGRFRFEVTAADFDPALALLAACAGPELACDDDGGDGVLPAATLALRAGDPVVVGVDGYAGGEGTFTLVAAEVPPAEVACADGLDDDQDGAADCRDADCGCVEDCANGVDDDADYDADCDDAACAFDPACAEDCADGRDDDGDGHTDCADLGCLGIAPCGREACAGGHDDDGDGAIDCADPACATDPACPEACDDGSDGDGDGDVDCADAACDAFAACAEGCRNGRDDDGDARVDCADPACFAEPACAAPCAERPWTAGVPGVVVGDTTGGSDQLGPVSCGGGPPGAPDEVWVFTAPVAGVYAFDTAGSALDAVIFARDACAPALEDRACGDGAAGRAGVIWLGLAAGEEVRVVVDGRGGAAGPYTLTIRLEAAR